MTIRGLALDRAVDQAVSDAPDVHDELVALLAQFLTEAAGV
jgi:hypothetical protein